MFSYRRSHFMKNRTFFPALTVLRECYPWLSSPTEWVNVFITFMQQNNPVPDHLHLPCLTSLEAIPVFRYTLQVSVIHRHLPWKRRLKRKPKHWSSFNTRAVKPREIIPTSDAIILSYWRRHGARHTAVVFQLLDITSAFYIDLYADWLASWKCGVSEMLLLNKWKKQEWSRGCAPCCVPYVSKETRQAAGNINDSKYQRRQQTKVRIYSTCIFATKSTAMLSFCTTRTGFQHWIRFISIYSVMSSPLS